MDTSQIYVLISIIVLAIIMVVRILIGRKTPKPLSKLTAFAFLFIIAGIIFGGNQLIGYSLTGIGMVLAVIDIVKNLKKPSV